MFVAQRPVCIDDLIPAPATIRGTVSALQARVDGLALEGQHAEDALVDAAQGFPSDEALQRLDAEREFANGE